MFYTFFLRVLFYFVELYISFTLLVVHLFRLPPCALIYRFISFILVHFYLFLLRFHPGHLRPIALSPPIILLSLWTAALLFPSPSHFTAAITLAWNTAGSDLGLVPLHHHRYHSQSLCTFPSHHTDTLRTSSAPTARISQLPLIPITLA